MNESKKTEFRVVSQTFDSWNVQFRIEVSQLLDKEALLLHLRGIKHGLAEQFSVSEQHLIFDGILRKVRTEECVDVVVRIRQRRFEKGNPTLHFEDALAPDGTPFTNMKAKLDLYYLDAFDNPIMLDRVRRAIREARVAEDMVDSETVHSAVKRVLETQKPEHNIEIARGSFAEIGEDAIVEFYFQAVVELGKINEYYSSKRVRPGDLLCRVTPAAFGRTSGRNVKGQELPPRQGLTIDLVAGSGATLSFDHCDAVSEEDGVVTVSRELIRVSGADGMKELPHKIHVGVNPVLKIEGGHIIDLDTSKSVEIIGNLSMGSRVLTDADVFVSGNVEAGSTIDAGSDVVVEGMIRGATIRTQKNVVAHGDVADSELRAKDRLVIKGRVKNSELHGDEVTAGDVTGSKIVARTKAILNSIDADESQVLSTICVGMSEFFRQRILDNDVFIKKARENLIKIESVIGADVCAQVNVANIQNMMLKVLARRKVGEDKSSKKQADTLRKLVEAVPPTRELLMQKERENLELLDKLADEELKSGNVVVIREKIGNPILATIDKIEAEIPPVKGPVIIKSDGAVNLVVEYATK